MTIREDFEEWYTSLHGEDRSAFRCMNGEYMLARIASHWTAYQAATAQSAARIKELEEQAALHSATVAEEQSIAVAAQRGEEAAKVRIAELEERVRRMEGDAERYRFIRRVTGGGPQYGGGKQHFILPDIKPLGDIMKGSVAGHFDAAIDAKLTEAKAEAGNG